MLICVNVSINLSDMCTLFFLIIYILEIPTQLFCFIYIFIFPYDTIFFFWIVIFQYFFFSNLLEF